MDHNERQQLRQLANDSIITTFGQDTNEARLAQALERACEAIGDFETLNDKVEALEEENDILELEIDSLKDALREVEQAVTDAYNAVTTYVTKPVLTKG